MHNAEHTAGFVPPASMKYVGLKMVNLGRKTRPAARRSQVLIPWKPSITRD